MIRQLLVIGETAGMDAAVSSALQQAQQVRCFPTLTELWAQPPIVSDLLLVLQHWPDEYSSFDVGQLLKTYPLSRLIVCQGIWCASYGRTRHGWPAAVCVAAENVPRRIARELAVLSGACSPLPWTAGLDEIFAFDQS